jgi:isopenicillin-N epimerase
MIGSMAAVLLPWIADVAAAQALGRALEAEDRIQVPIVGWPAPAARDPRTTDRILVRISAQRYNEPADYERLATALARRLSRLRQAGATR